LPSGWTTTATGAQAAWRVSTATTDTAPNAAFVTDASNIGLSELITPSFLIVSTSAQLVFRNNYNLDADKRRATIAYDGGVLEIKVGTGQFTDILAAGGSFVDGGYSRTISSAYGNPLGGRQAWSGTSGGYVTTRVNLPASAAGQSIALKWRCGTDNSTSGAGWYIDTISILDGSYECCGSGTGPTAPAIARVESTGTGVAIYATSLPGVLYTLEYKNSLTDPGWIPLPPAVPGTGSQIVFHDGASVLTNRFYLIRGE
jgi:hypothetical protein